MSRPSKTAATRESQQTLDEACVYGAKLVRDVLRGKQGRGTKNIRVSSSKLMAAKIAIEHSLGLPKAKVYVKTDALSMQDIAELAALFDENGTESGENSLDNVPVIDVPTKPLTARQIKERAKN